MSTATLDLDPRLARNVRAVKADLVPSRADVRVDRRFGWVTDKRYDSLIGLVRADKNASGHTIWHAQAGDVQGWAFKREDAIQTVIDLHNMQEKARSYDLLSGLLHRAMS